jgi:hypothetical protein
VERFGDVFIHDYNGRASLIFGQQDRAASPASVGSQRFCAFHVALEFPQLGNATNSALPVAV